ncbi:MAG: heavy metal-associated domain-containing protein [Bacteroidota bacterium]|nr:heavy metal-associated domain-containing protein [Bacteroidota bacterium]
MYQYIVLSVLLISLLAGCGQKQAEQQTELNLESATITTSSIMCGMCVTTIEKAVSAVDGVESVEVNLQEKSTTVKFDKAKLEIAALEKSISDAGYDANEIPRNRETYDALPGCCKDGK